MIIYIEYLSSTDARYSVLNKNPDIQRIKQNTVLLYLIPLLLLGGNLIYLVFSGQIESVRGYYLIHYLYDYSHGFVARGLVGEVLSRFFDIITDEITYGVMILFDSLLVISSSLCFGKALSRVKDDSFRFNCILFLIVLICIFPFSFRSYHMDFKLDKLLWALTLFAVFIADNKIGIFLTPFICAAATMVNPVFLFCSMILISIILLQKLCDSKFSAKHIVICFVAYSAMIAIGIYGTLNEKNLGFDNPTEMLNYYFSRYSGIIPDDVAERFVTEWIFEYFDSPGTIIKKAYDIYLVQWNNKPIVILNAIFFAVPVYTFLSIFWIDVIKAEEKKFQKFIFFLCLISPVVLIPPIVLSWESSKYFANNIMVQLGLIIYYLANNNQSVLSAVYKLKKRFGNNFVICSAAALYLALLIK